KLPERRPSAEEVRDRLSALDPDPARARARARQDGYLGPRAGRMVPAGARAESSDAPLEVGVVGAISAELALGLMANGITAFAVRDDEPIGPDTAVILAVALSREEVAALARGGVPVVVALERAE